MIKSMEDYKYIILERMNYGLRLYILTDNLIYSLKILTRIQMVSLTLK
jgi:hypothetical protein